jgi:hypothetical protein
MLSGALPASLLKKNVPEVAIDAVPADPMTLIVNVMYSSQFLLVVEGSVIVPLDAKVTAPAIIAIDICSLLADVIWPEKNALKESPT